MDSDVAVAFLRRYPTQHSAARLTQARFAAFLRRIAYCGRKPVDELFARGHDAPEAALNAAVADGYAVSILALPRAIEHTRFPDEESLAALAGVAPVTRASGKIYSVGFRWAADKKLRSAIIGFADDSRHASPWAAKIYNDAINRDKRHPHAVRILARAWTRVIRRCWHDHTAYNPQLHGGAIRLAAA